MMWLLFFLFSFFTFLSFYTTGIENEDLRSLALQLNHLEAAIDDEIQVTKDLVHLIEKRSLSQRALPGKIPLPLVKKNNPHTLFEYFYSLNILFML